MKRRAAFPLFLGVPLLILFNETNGTETLSFQGSEDRVQLLELFTSQGCSSCPPAERWINQFIDHPGLWSEIVPVVYHVNHWDRLGWKDPFVSKQFTQRQYDYAENGRFRQVYTPCFVSNGNEWRGCFSKESLSNEKGKAGVLQATIEKGRMTVSYSEEKPLTLNVAILGLDLETDVKRGENRGRKLNQQFVALDHQTSTSSSGKWAIKMPSIDPDQAHRFAIAIWVTKRGKSEPLQATGSWIDSHHFN